MPVQSTASQQELPAWLLQTFQGMNDRAQQLAGNRNAPVYGGQRLAPLTPESRRARELGNQTGSYSPYLQESTRMVRGAKTPFSDRAKDYMNPYMQQVVDRIALEGNRNLTENILPAIAGRNARLGKFGGSNQTKQMRQAARDIQGEISANQARALAQGYQQSAQIYNADQARALEAAKEMSGLGTMNQAGRLADIAMLMEQGRYGQQQNQAANDIAYQDFLRQQNYPWEMLQNQAAIMHGIPKPMQETGAYQTPGTPQLNLLGQMGPMAIGLLGARMARG